MLPPTIALLCLAAVLTACTPAAAPNPEDPPTSLTSWRQIDMRQRSPIFASMKPTVMSTQADLDEFVNRVGSRPHGAGREIADALADANIDFDRETLVIVPITESSGSVKVTFKGVKIDGDGAVCMITRDAPRIGTTDMAYHGFAVVVSKDVRTLRVRVDGRDGDVVDLRGPA